MANKAKRWDLAVNPYNRPGPSLLRGWYAGKYRVIARAKKTIWIREVSKRFLKAFPTELRAVKPLATKVWDVLFPYRGALYGAMAEDAEFTVQSTG
jgi:hypothetical protein